MALLSKQGYGQLEPNFLIAQRTGEVYAQLPFTGFSGITSNGFQAIEQGMFLKYDYAKQVVSMPSTGGDKLTFLVMNEIRLFGPFLTNKDFALFPSPSDANSSYTNSGIIPGLAQSANQILGTSGNLVVNINAGGSGYGLTYPTVTVNFNDGTSITSPGTSTTGVTFTVTMSSGVVTGITTAFVATGKSPTSITLSGPLAAGTTSQATASVFLNTAINAAAGYTSGSPAQAYGSQVVYPRLYKPTVGDVITTNLVCTSTGAFYGAAAADLTSFPVNAVLEPNANGVLQSTGGSTVTSSSTLAYRIVTNTTTPDLQNAVKLQCIQTP
jgi:hypothetical protein